MPTPEATLRQLYSLKTSSSDFLRVLYAFFRSDEDEQYSKTLDGPELTRLVDFLDEVRPLLRLFPVPLQTKTPKALCSIHNTDDVFRQCLRKLRAICGTHAILPTSHIISGDLVERTGVSAIDYGGFADVWVGNHVGNRVCIKALRIPLNDAGGLRKVRIQGIPRQIVPCAERRPWAL